MIFDKPLQRDAPKAPPPPAQAPAMGKPFSAQSAVFSLDAWILDWVTRVLKRWRLETFAPTIAWLISTYAQNPFFLWLAVSALWALAGLIGGTGYVFGALFVNYVLIAVHLLKMSIGSSLLGFAMLGGGITLFAIGWVRASRWHPYAFGFLEIGMGVGISLEGFRDAQSDYAALFALIGGAFTAIDGCQRIADAKDRQTLPASSG
jgi:hypothetical protein